MSEHAIRFGVRSADGHISATWKCWTPGTPKHDVYLACRALKGELKASLHQSGNWHIAFTPQMFTDGFADSSDRPGTRFMDSWPRPKEIASGLTLAFRVWIPWFSATMLDTEPDSAVIWIPPAPKEHTVEVAILISAPGCQMLGWPGKDSMHTMLVGSFALESGENVWLVHQTTPFNVSASIAGTARFFKGFDREVLNHPELRVVMFGDMPDGSRVMVEGPITTQVGSASVP